MARMRIEAVQALLAFGTASIAVSDVGQRMARGQRDGPASDLFVEMKVQTPARLTKRQRELLQELHSTLSVENTPVSRSLLNKVKDTFFPGVS